MRKKTYVLDTSVLIADPEVLLKLRGCRIIVPVATIGELDRLKTIGGPAEPRARAARKVARILDSLGSGQDISAGARTPAGATVTIYRTHANVSGLLSGADNKVLGTAVKLKMAGRSEVVLLSNDGNMRNVSRAYGIRATSYPFPIDSSPAPSGSGPGDTPAPAMTDSVAHVTKGMGGPWLYLSVTVAVVIFLALLAAAR